MKKNIVFATLISIALMIAIINKNWQTVGVCFIAIIIFLDFVYLNYENKELENDIEEMFYMLKDVTETFDIDNKPEQKLMNKIRQFSSIEDNE